MSRDAAIPRQYVIERCIRAAVKAGVKIGAVEVKPDGSILILTPEQLAVSSDPFTEWERTQDGKSAA